MTLPVRDATADDMPALRAIQKTVLAEPWPELLSVAVDGGPILLVSPDRADDPAGYALAIADEDEATGYLAELAVAPAHQNEGRGSALLDTLADRLAGENIDKLRVTVRVVDDDVRQFYRDRGFERRERLSDHYETGDGLLLEREL